MGRSAQAAKNEYQSPGLPISTNSAQAALRIALSFKRQGAQCGGPGRMGVPHILHGTG